MTGSQPTRSTMATAAAAFLLATLVATTGVTMAETKQMTGLSPVLVVERIEPCLELWTKRLGFERTAEVPGEDGLAFVMLVRDDVTVMYQSVASIREDIPALAEEPFRSALFLSVTDRAASERGLEGVELVFSRRRTFYGTTEVAVKDDAGNVITFAQHDEQGS